MLEELQLETPDDAGEDSEDYMVKDKEPVTEPQKSAIIKIDGERKSRWCTIRNLKEKNSTHFLKT